MAATRKIQSVLFGAIEVPEQKMFLFRNGIPGLEKFRECTFLDIPEYKPLIWMTSGDGQFHFPVLPVSYFSASDFDEVSQSVYLPQLVDLLEHSSHLVAYVILKLAAPVSKISLKAPIVVDSEKRTGEQVILDRFVLTPQPV